jgi:TrmH family RNA methyltransferase
LLRQIKILKTKKGRDETGQFIVEGEINVREIPDNWEIVCYAAAETYANSRDLSALRRRAPCQILRDSVFGAISDTKTPQGILAVCRQKRCGLTDILRDNAFLLMGEAIADPGNIGALIRTAAAAGAALCVPVAAGVADIAAAITTLKHAGIAVYAAHLKGGVYPYTLDLRAGFCFLIGNESRGLSDSAAELADSLVRLPMPGGIESLNAAVAGSILMYEAVRQRIQ